MGCTERSALGPKPCFLFVAKRKLSWRSGKTFFGRKLTLFLSKQLYFLTKTSFCTEQCRVKCLGFTRALRLGSGGCKTERSGKAWVRTQAYLPNSFSFQTFFLLYCFLVEERQWRVPCCTLSLFSLNRLSVSVLFCPLHNSPQFHPGF